MILLRQGYETHLPMIEVCKGRQGKWAVVAGGPFPKLFVCLTGAGQGKFFGDPFSARLLLPGYDWIKVCAGSRRCNRPAICIERIAKTLWGGAVS